MDKDITTKLVGAYFRPPASAILSAMPSGVPLRLVPNWDNPYDSLAKATGGPGAAIKIYLHPGDIPQDFHEDIDLALDGTGFTMEELLASAEEGELISLGFVADSAGKPLVGTGLPGNREFKAALGGGDRDDAWIGKPVARLVYGPDSQPMIRLLATAVNEAESEWIEQESDKHAF